MGQPLSELVMRHRGKRICLMGGGPTLSEDLAGVKADVFVSCNEHGSKVRRADYVMAMDNIHTRLKVPMKQHIRAHTDAPIIGPWGWCDYTMNTWPLSPRVIMTGVVGSWVCALMGAHPLILAGFDVYGGDGLAMGQHEQYVSKVFAEVRVMSGPLLKWWPQYDRNERMSKYAPPDVFKAEPDLLKECRVRVLKAVEINGEEWPVGSILTVARHEARLKIKHKSLEEV